ncbi:MAG TPA: hypothetical protein VNV86_12110, partial [Candidatus Acidoferrum sp.]|nr:hypothetical protein [Candidatus Acidoferrum sp.]
IAAAAVLIVSATRLLYHEWRRSHPVPPPPALPPGPFVLAQLPDPNFWREVSPAVTASLSLQTAITALMLHVPMLAAVSFAMFLSLGTAYTLTRRPPHQRPPESLPRSLLGVLLTLVLAIGLTVGGMLPGMLHGGGSGLGFGEGNGNGGNATAASPASKPEGAGTSDRPDLSKFPDAGAAEGGFPGVILWPEIKPYATLIAPMTQRADGLGTVEAKPMVIPFSGEYWMFRWPFAKPPRTSYFQRGSPANLSFKTTDHRSLQMEARHQLEQSIALDCCSRIQLAIRNADRFPNTIAIELVLIDNEHSGLPPLSLGHELVASVPDLRHEPVKAVNETLSFAVPNAAPIAAFNEFKIVFQRDRRRADQSAKVAVDRFVLIPRL